MCPRPYRAVKRAGRLIHGRINMDDSCRASDTLIRTLYHSDNKIGESKINKIPATLIEGDGIGPEITEATVDVLDALQAPLNGLDSRRAWQHWKNQEMCCQNLC